MAADEQLRPCPGSCPLMWRWLLMRHPADVAVNTVKKLMQDLSVVHSANMQAHLVDFWLFMRRLCRPASLGQGTRRAGCTGLRWTGTRGQTPC